MKVRTKGLKIALSGKSVEGRSEDLVYTSDNESLRARINRTPPHFDLIKYTFADNPPKPASHGDISRTVLATVNHDLGYVPASLGFVFITASSNDNNSVLGGAYFATPVFISQADVGSQYITYSVDNKNLYLIYQFQNIDSFSPTYVDVTGLSFEFKYYIFVTDGL